MKSIYKIVTVCLLGSISLFSCSEDELVKKGTPGDGETLQITISSTPSRVADPMTKAATKADTEKVTDLNILLYDESTGNLIEEESQYYSGGDAGLSTLSQAGQQSTTYSLKAEPGDKSIYLIANAGDVRKDSRFATKSGLSTLSFHSDLNGDAPALVMSGVGDQVVNVNDASRSQVSASLKRIYSMITVQVVKDLNNNIQVIPYQLELKNVASKGMFLESAANKIGSSGISCEEAGGRIGGSETTEILREGHDSAIPLFLYENLQGKGLNIGSLGQSYKTPPAIGTPVKDYEAVKDDKTCSYIELTARYDRGKGNNDKIIYRFFLGEDATNDFNVERNCYYKITLNLHGDGGVDEASWRVDKQFMNEIQVQDVYVGYLAGSETYIPVAGDIDAIVGNPTITRNPTSQGRPVFEIFRNAHTSEGRTYVKVNATNTQVYGNNTCEVTYTVRNGDGSTKRVVARVHQVPRLVDPIAIYKSAKNTDVYPVTVRAYNPDERKYEVMESVGAWSAQIESFSGSTACWFKIYDDDESTQTVGGVISGEGTILFDYQPLSPNNADDRVSNPSLAFQSEAADRARYGVILVKYHNLQCEHRIYLRQGYQPTTISNTTWSMFNCLGMQPNGRQAYTQYPTETGWLFKGDSNVGMNPFDPGYEENPGTNLQFSDGSRSGFRNAPYAKGTWVESRRSNNAKQGPCPTGYKLANAPALYDLCQNTSIYSGFVYDDSEIRGYSYDSQGNMYLSDEDKQNNYCNPAKGTLFVDNNGANIFFTYGKGILTKHSDPNLINEIGVGHRGIDHDYPTSNNRGGYLKYFEFLKSDNGGLVEHSYGAFYWGATRFGDSDRLSRVCVSYDILTEAPYFVDRLENPGSTGIDSYWHGSFVRCVRE